MLLELRIRNYAVIDSADLELRPGLNVLTGETGAGKSIVVGALSLLLGERAQADVVRPGAARATVEGVFAVGGREDVQALLDDQGIPREDGILILRREVASEGRNRAWVNGAAATAALVGELGRRLVDLHGQHEHQTLLRSDEQRDILDAFAKATAAAEAVARAHAALRAGRRSLQDLTRRRGEVAERADLLARQVDEIDAVGIRDDEESALDGELRRLENAEELGSRAEELHQTLYAGPEAVLSVLDRQRRLLDAISRLDPGVEQWRGLLETAQYAVDEAGRAAGEYARSVELDPARLDALRHRKDLLFRLRRRYGPELSDVLETARRAKQELALLEDGALEQKDLERTVHEAEGSLRRAAAELGAMRAEAAIRLSERVSSILPGLGLADGRFEAALAPREEIAETGGEGVEFRVILNVGFESRPLQRIASGGELSRVMLALKTVLAEVDRVPTLVFDEIDAGIGGQVGHRIGETLQEVAAHHQVLVITHLPQVAGRADHHLLVEKVEETGVTGTRLVALDREERIAELVRMMGGDPHSEASLGHALEMVQPRAAAF